MKVALIVPTYEYLYPGPTYLAPSDFPVGLAYLAAALKKAGHEVIGLNVNNHPSYPSKRAMLDDMLKTMLEQERPQLIGLGGLCADYAFIKDALGIIRTVAPGTPVVCGGGIITHDAQFIFSTLRPDYCIKGEAEEALVQLVEHLETGKPALLNIPNLGFWQGGKAMFTSENFSYPALENRPWPDYSPFDPETMLACSTHGARLLYRYSRPEPRIMPFVAARNCPFKCTFCVHEQGPRYSARPMADIFAELEHLYATYRFNILIILDELFAIDKDRLREFCEGILERQKTLGWDFDWLFQTHASVGLTLEDMKLARKAGCYYFSYGIESASPRVLASMKKKIRPSQIKEAIELSAQAGIGFGGNLIFGDIAETPETIAESMGFMMENCLDMQIYTTNISPYPGSLLFEYCLQQGLIKDKLQYYETIDRVIYNMTAMPDAAWGNWLRTITWPLTSYPFVVGVEPLAVEDEPAQAGSLIPPQALPIRRVHARCPHCGTEQSYRQPIADEALADGSASVVPGCPTCGKRFRIQLNREGRYSGALLGRQIAPADLTRTIQESLIPLTGLRQRVNVLLIVGDTEKWRPDHAQRYLAGLGLEEGLAANGMSFQTVVALREHAPGEPGSWLSHLKTLCTGKQFDQVWVDVVDTRLDDPALAFIAAQAPVRLALIGESLQFGELIYRIAPAVKTRQRLVDKRLRAMTHVLASDERDAQWLSRNKKLQALWWAPALPQRLIRTSPPASPDARAQVAGDGAWPVPAELAERVRPYQPAPDMAQIAQLFEQTNDQVLDAMYANRAFQDSLFNLHIETLRQIHRVAVDTRLGALANALAVVAPPATDQSFIGNVLEGMASHRPVIACDVEGRMALAALFADGEEILRVPADADPASAIAAHLQRLAADPTWAARLAERAAAKLAEHHTVERRVAQIAEWLKHGAIPAYAQAIPREDADKRRSPVACVPPAAAPDIPPLPDNPVHGDQRLVAAVHSAREAFQRGAVDESMLILAAAKRDYPWNADVITLWSQVEAARTEQVRAKIRSAWSAPAACEA